METLKYFTSVAIDDPKEAMKGLEDVLQQEHGTDGKHPIASLANAGFISANDYKKLQNVLTWFEQNIVSPTS